MDSQLLSYLRWRDRLPDVSTLDADEAWRVFTEAHEGACAICREPPKATAKRAARLIVDHDHTLGYVRGLLCRGCNQRAGSGWDHRRLSLSETPTVDLYVQFPPAIACGLRRLYEGVFWAEAADRLSDALWLVDQSGDTELLRDIQAMELIERMRDRDWSQG